MTAAAQFVRLKDGKGAVVRFTIDGRPAEARAGDTLMTAVLLNGRHLRRFEFGDGHRSGFCLMAGCQDCWVTLADGRRLRGCTTKIEPGMAVVVDGVAGGGADA